MEGQATFFGAPISSVSRGWLAVLLIFLPALFLQTMFVSCACYAGAAKAEAIFYADLVIVARSLVGIIQRHKNRSWIIYALLYPSLIPITELASRLAGSH